MAAHGTRACYQAGCRRRECLDAHNEYNRWLKRQQAAGLPTTRLVDAWPARWHVRKLMAQGMGRRNIAEASGARASTLHQLLYGKQGRTVMRIRRETAEALLAVRPRLEQLLPATNIDSTGTRRRVQALIATGWTMEAQARQLGWNRSRLDYLLSHELCTVATALAVRAFYERAWRGPAAPRGPYEAEQQRRARKRAWREGWGPPMSWDDDKIDDPDAKPQGIRPLDDVA